MQASVHSKRLESLCVTHQVWLICFKHETEDTTSPVGLSTCELKCAAWPAHCTARPLLVAAFIKLASVDAAHTAIKALHNTKLGGRTIIVKSAEQDCEYGEDLACACPITASSMAAGQHASVLLLAGMGVPSP